MGQTFTELNTINQHYNPLSYSHVNVCAEMTVLQLAANHFTLNECSTKWYPTSCHVMTLSEGKQRAHTSFQLLVCSDYVMSCRSVEGYRRFASYPEEGRGRFIRNVTNLGTNTVT